MSGILPPLVRDLLHSTMVVAGLPKLPALTTSSPLSALWEDNPPELLCTHWDPSHQLISLASGT